MRKKLIDSILLVAGLMIGSVAQASYVAEIETNDWINEAQSLTPYFSTEFDKDIINSTTMAHASVKGTGDQSMDFFSFTLSALSGVILDIDYGMDEMDPFIQLYNSTGNSIDFNGNAYTTDPGSSSSLDSYLKSTLNAGLYYVKVIEEGKKYVDYGKDYTLHVSVDPSAVSVNPSVVSAVPAPAALPLMLSGLGMMGFFTRRKQKSA